MTLPPTSGGLGDANLPYELRRNPVFRTARRDPPCGLPRERRTDPSADTTILKSGGKGSVGHDIVADTRLGDEAHGVGATEIAPIGGDREALVIRQRRATQGDR